MAAHSNIGASSAHRWMSCYGSVQMCANMPNTTSPYAAQGTLAHELCEMLLGGHALPDMGAEMLVDGYSVVVDQEMIDCVTEYVDYVRRIAGNDGELLVEHRFDLSSLYPGMFGTADAVVIKRDQLHVIDFKYGAGVRVQAEGNAQGQYYAYGAYDSLSPAKRRDVDKVTIHIFQPRAGGASSWTVPLADLVEWSWMLQDKAERTADPDAPLVPGSWCKFCPALPQCPAVQEKVNATARADFDDDPAGMDGYALSAALENAELIDQWISSVRSHAYDQACKGVSIPGFKLVAKRAMRKWIDEDLAAAALEKAGADRAALFPPKLISPAQAEKLVGKKTFAGGASAHVIQESSGTTLVRENDRRPAVTPTTPTDLFEEADNG